MLIYSSDRKITVPEFRDLLVRSKLGERRPIDDLVKLEGMVENADLTVSCWDGDFLVGVARSVTDFHRCCYLADLAVDTAYQKQGIGKRLVEGTKEVLNEGCSIILLSAPAAVGYYPRIGFEKHEQAWVLPG